MYTSSRFSRHASMILLSNCPPRPTNGSPSRSSSAPGASPMKTQAALPDCRRRTPFASESTPIRCTSCMPRPPAAILRAKAPAELAGDAASVVSNSVVRAPDRQPDFVTRLLCRFFRRLMLQFHAAGAASAATIAGAAVTRSWRRRRRRRLGFARGSCMTPARSRLSNRSTTTDLQPPSSIVHHATDPLAGQFPASQCRHCRHRKKGAYAGKLSRHRSL